MRQKIKEKLNRLFSGTIDRIKIVYYNCNSQVIMKFEMLRHQIKEENDTIRIFDDTDNSSFTPKTVMIHSLDVNSVAYEDDKTEDSILHTRKVIIRMNDKSRIELSTSAIG